MYGVYRIIKFLQACAFTEVIDNLLLPSKVNVKSHSSIGFEQIAK